jgi:hypothetical protein
MLESVRGFPSLHLRRIVPSARLAVQDEGFGEYRT